MAYDLFLFDADDTLFDFRASERLSFVSTFEKLGVRENIDEIFQTYRQESTLLWSLLEKGQTTKDILKVERFRRTFEKHNLDHCPMETSTSYLDTLPDNVVLIEHAENILKYLSAYGEIGIITNGIEYVQRRRLEKSGLGPYISFMTVSEECGFAKPDVRFFEYTVKFAKKFSKASSLVIGDRMEADILGAHNFGVDACLFNPHRTKLSGDVMPKFEISHLSELESIIAKA